MREPSNRYCSPRSPDNGRSDRHKQGSQLRQQLSDDL